MTEKWRNEQNMNANSGSELMMKGLERELGEEFLEDFQIILSRPRELDETKIRIFWAHDLPNDPESVDSLKNGGWKKFHRFVFVSNWQAQRYIEMFGIPWSKTVVMRNAIQPIDVDMDKKWDVGKENQIRLIYHTTPHRGLALLVPIFQELCKHHDNIHLDVYSSFKLYGWDESDEEFSELYKIIEEHEHMTYHGSVDNSVVRDALTEAHIFAYPCVHTETSCIALIEAMNAGVMCIHPNNGALYETSSNWTFMYPWHESHQEHAKSHFEMVNHAINLIRENDEGLKMKLSGQKSFSEVNYSWDIRSHEWRAFLDSCRNLDRKIEDPNNTWTYKVG